MAGVNPPKPPSNKPSSFSASSHQKPRWESTATGAAAPKTSAAKPSASSAAAAAEPKKPVPTAALPSNSKPSPKPTTNPSPKPNPNPSPNHANLPINPSPRPQLGPFPENLGPPPPPAYGFHMLDRRTIHLADGSVRSYFALPPEYQDFSPLSRPSLDPSARFLPQGPELALGFDRPSGPTRDDPFRRPPIQDHMNSLGSENSHKRKYVDEGDRRGKREEREGMEPRDDFARQRQQLLQYGKAGPSGGYEIGRGEEMRATKIVRPDGEYGSFPGRQGGLGGNLPPYKHNEVDQKALKKALLNFVKLINENPSVKKNFLADGKQGPLQCLVCSRSSKDFPDMHALILHAFNSEYQVPDHLGLHKALCILMGWNFAVPPDNSMAYRYLSAEEAAANKDDLILWPPLVIVQNTSTGKGKDGRTEGLGNKAMDNKLRELGFGSGKSKSMYSTGGHLGVALVKFTGDQLGLKEAVRLAEFFEKNNHGRQAWASLQPSLISGKDEDSNPHLVKVDKKTGEKERIFYGHLASVFDLEKVDFETRKKVGIESRREYKPT